MIITISYNISDDTKRSTIWYQLILIFYSTIYIYILLKIIDTMNNKKWNNNDDNDTQQLQNNINNSNNMNNMKQQHTATINNIGIV